MNQKKRIWQLRSAYEGISENEDEAYFLSGLRLGRVTS
jgi:hypothetical protein